MVSKCLCCQRGAGETVKHVFSEGQVAQGVWNYFGRICAVSQRGSSLRAWLTAWWMSHPRSKKDRFLFSVLPVLYAGTSRKRGIKHIMKGFRCV